MIDHQPAAVAVAPQRPATQPHQGRRTNGTRIRRTAGDRVADVIIAVVLVLLALATVYPFLYQFTISLSTPAQAMQTGWHLFPTEITFESYRTVLSDSGIFTAYRNTIIRTVLATVLAVLLTASVAYPLAQPEFPHRRLLNFVLVFSLLVSGGFLAMYLLVRSLGLLDTVWALALPGSVTAFNVIIMRNFFQAIPRELTDSGRIDGASELQIMFRIVLPLSKPVLAVVALWVALANWNAWFDALLYITDPDKQVLQMFVRNAVLSRSTPLVEGSLDTTQQAFANVQTLSAAALMVATIPIICLYPFLQKYFARGILLGSVKG
ncbi:carbohydrate ABC transporter permease [Occultella kanbiaonis]|uniref:carbohydrate ABC transporter permease n=1 Tax=Occultella kanbiaonis TaxID=2675754 RepID=UPI0012BA315E|nr:carbohydrate ABC transporter permease [Occultella kanbiaonis]